MLDGSCSEGATFFQRSNDGSLLDDSFIRSTDTDGLDHNASLGKRGSTFQERLNMDQLLQLSDSGKDFAHYR